MKKIKIVNVYDKLSDSKLTKMDANGKFKIVKITLKLEEIYKEYQELLKETVRRLKPSWFEGDKVTEWEKNNINSDKLSGEEKAEIIKYVNEVNSLIEEEFNKEVKLDIDKLSEEEWKEFIDSNDYTARQLIDFIEILYENN